ncbi:MAG TPA: hypothetical protein VN667_15405 [Burkholderiales bacterium]|nr:hypothetical protein [Burkholderiales bacterium]
MGSLLLEFFAGGVLQEFGEAHGISYEDELSTALPALLARRWAAFRFQITPA